MRNKKELNKAKAYDFKPVERDREREKAIRAAMAFIEDNLNIRDSSVCDEDGECYITVELFSVEPMRMSPFNHEIAFKYYIDLTGDLAKQVGAIKADQQRMTDLMNMFYRASEGISQVEVREYRVEDMTEIRSEIFKK